jgi:pyridine nucleotide-disulfide oxidoreductase family protein
MDRPLRPHLVLVGGGHAHVIALDYLARAAPDARITLVAPYERQIYSGMLPGWIAGHYRLEQCAIALQPLARRAGAQWVQTRAVGLELDRRRLLTEHGSLEFDLLSIATGPDAALQGVEGAATDALSLRPIEAFIAQWQRRWTAWCTQPVARRVAVVGAGAAGVEIALAIVQAARRAALLLSVQLIGAGGLVPSLSGSARRRCAGQLAQARVTVHEEAAVAIGRDSVRLSGGAELAADATILASGPAPPNWLQGSGLQRDRLGFVAVERSLRSTSHPFVFAAGDCATLLAAPHPKSGVFAVRAGPWLARNLAASLTGRPLRNFEPQQRALYLLSAGTPHAIGSWGPLGFEGRWVWRLKDWIDRRFVARFSVGQ